MEEAERLCVGKELHQDGQAVDSACDTPSVLVKASSRHLSTYAKVRCSGVCSSLGGQPSLCAGFIWWCRMRAPGGQRACWSV